MERKGEMEQERVCKGEGKPDLKSMTLPELTEYIQGLGEPRFRGNQIFHWIHRGAWAFQDMVNLPLVLRDKLSRVARIEKLELLRMQNSKQDGTRKYLFGLSDGHGVESVFMKYHHGNTACISSQAGCRMGCAFCASTADGLLRNLTPGEMLDQILSIQKDTGERIGNVVVMGTGEPLDNYEALSAFLRILHQEGGLNLSYRAVTVSTCGLIPGMERFGREFPQVNLAVSLHGPTDEIRGRLMPVNRTYPLDALISACKRHVELTGRRVTFEYALIQGVNDRDQDAAELACKLSDLLCHVNLIPLNKVEEKEFSGSDRKDAERFRGLLERNGITATVRRELGSDIDAACGQLRLNHGRGTFAPCPGMDHSV